MDLFKASPKSSIRLHTILIGASPLIPIPFLDELLVWYFRRHMVADLAKKHMKTLTPLQVRQLADEQSGGGCLGAIGSIIGFFITELVRDIFFWLEWKRGIDLATEAYHFGYLVDEILGREDFSPQNASIYRQAIGESLQGFQMSRFREAMQRTFSSSKTFIRTVTSWLLQFGKYYLGLLTRPVRERGQRLFTRFRRRKVSEASAPDRSGEAFDEFLQDEQKSPPKITHLMESLSQTLETETGNMQGYFEHLSRRLEQRMKFYSEPQNVSALLAAQSRPSPFSIASLVTSLLAAGSIPLILLAFYGQRYWDSGLLRFITAWTPCLTAIMILLGAGAGLVSLSERPNKNTFGLVGVLLSGLTFLSCCLIFVLIVFFRKDIGA